MLNVVFLEKDLGIYEVLGNICITIVCFPGCDVMNFEINLIFLIKSFFSMTKKSRQKFYYLENEMSFWGEIKSIFHHFQRDFNYRNLPQTWGCVFNLSASFDFWYLLNQVIRHQEIINYKHWAVTLIIYRKIPIFAWNVGGGGNFMYILRN